MLNNEELVVDEFWDRQMGGRLAALRAAILQAFQASRRSHREHPHDWLTADAADNALETGLIV
jgi:hypothetical protein